MNIANRKILPLLLIAALALGISSGIRPANAAGTLYVSPAHSFLTPPLPPVGTIFTVKIQVANIDPFNAWDISVLTDNTVISPQSLDITGNLLAVNFTTTVFPLINCINGAGTGCIATDGAGIAHSAVTGFGPPPQPGASSGLLFTITYKVVGTGAFSAIHIFSDVIANGATGLAVPHTTVDGTYGQIVDIPPIAKFTVTGNNTVVGSTVGFNGAASTDPDGSIISYAWTFGDGASAMGVTTSHMYGAMGTYTATLTVTDNGGKTGTASAKIGVLPVPVFDVAVSTPTPSPTAVLAGTPVTITFSVSNSATATTASPATTATATANGASVGTAPVGSLAPGGSASITITWDTTTAAAGTYTIGASVALTDSTPADNSATSPTLVTVTVPDCHFVHGKLSWTHHLSLAKNPSGQTFTAHLRCDTAGAEFVQVSVLGSSSAGMFTATSAATQLQPGVVTDVTFSQAVSTTFIGTKICFTASVHWGPTAATVMANLSPVTKSGCFAVVP